MKLLVISTAPLRGGAEEYAITIAIGAKAAGWTVVAATPESEATRSLVEELSASDIAVRRLPCIDPWHGGRAATHRKLVEATRETVRILRNVGPDVVHLTLAWPGFGLSSMVAPALLGIPTVVTYQLVPEHPILRWHAMVYRAIRARRQQWVAVSEHAREVLADALGMEAQSIEVIHNGVSRPLESAGHFEQRAVARTALRRELGVPLDSRIVLTVGRLHVQKAHADLCVAAGPLIERDGSLYVLLAGDGPERQNLERLIDTLGLRGRVQCLGRRRDVPRLLAGSDLFAFTSQFEGSPFALAEAMAAGLPLVTTAFPGSQEMVRNGEDGLVVPVGDTTALRDGLAWALDHTDAMRAMARSARDRARDFSHDRMVEKTLKLLAQSSR